GRGPCTLCCTFWSRKAERSGECTAVPASSQETGDRRDHGSNRRECAWSADCGAIMIRQCSGHADGAFWRDADFAHSPGPPLPALERFDRLPPAAGAARERWVPGCARCLAEEVRVRGVPPPSLALDAPARTDAVP